MKKVCLFFLTIVAVCISSATASGTTPEKEIEINGVHYIVKQAIENPIWLELAADEQHQKLQEINIEDVYHLEGYAYRNGSNWDTEKIRPAVVVKINDEALRQASIRTLHIPGSVKRIGINAFSGSQLQAISFSEGLLSIGEEAFRATYLSKVKLPESLRLIEYGAFMFCDWLEEVDLPSSLISLGGFTFQYCGEVKHIYSRALQPPLADGTDFGVLIDRYGHQIPHEPGPDLYQCILHVPEESIELYRNAPGWCLFRNIVAIADTDELDDITLDETSNAIAYRVEGNELIVSARAGEFLSIHDADGRLLDSHTFSAYGEFRHQGSGARIISIGDKSAKVIL